MNINQMNQLLCVLSCGSINKAAEKLNISQSGLSASIKAVENELGQPVLLRSHNGISFTPFGIEFISTAQKITEIYNQFLSTSIPAEKDRLFISSQFLLYAGSAFTSICSDNNLHKAKFRFTEKDSDGVLRDIVSGTSDIGIIVTPSVSRDLLFQILKETDVIGNIICTEESYCMVGPHSPLYQSPMDFVPLRQLALFPRLEYETRGILTDRKVFREQKEHFPSCSTITISDTGSFRQFLEQTNSFFIGIHNDNAYSQVSFYNNVRVLHIPDSQFTYDIIWLRRKGFALTPLVKSYLQLLYQLSGVEPADSIL